MSLDGGFLSELSECVSNKIKVLVDEGYDQDQAAAIAYKHCEGSEKQSNASPIDNKIVYEDDEILQVPVVVMKQGQFVGTNGRKQTKLFNEFASSAKWLEGVPILPGHVPGMVTAKDRRLGQLKTVRARDKTKDIHALAQFYKSDLLPEELEKIKNGQPFDGSIGYTCKIENENGEIIERGPYHFTEFAIVPKGACTSDDGCGFFQNSAPNHDCKCKKLESNHSHQPAPAIAGNGDLEGMTGEPPATVPDFGKLLNEAIAPLTKTIEEQGQTIKQLNAAFENLQNKELLKEEQIAKDRFGKLLNAAAVLDIDKIWPEAKKDVLAWTDAHPEKLMNVAPADSDLDGKLMNAGGEPFNLAAEQAKLWE